MSVSPYRWLHKLGSGSSGVVWAAVREGREVAVKVLRTESTPSSVETLRREMRIGPIIADHPGVVGVRRVEESGGALQLEMDLVRGPSLAQVLEGRLRERRGPLPASIVLPWIVDVLETLGWVGREVAPNAPVSFCHRDIKPANLLLDPSGRVRITDFGIARAQSELGFQTTATGIVKGSPRFMAPEVISERAPDARADQFSAAAVLYELVTGDPLYEGRDLPEVLMLAVQADIDGRMRALRSQPALVIVLRRMLAKSPAERFPTHEEAARALRGVAAPGPQLRDWLPELLTHAPDLDDVQLIEDTGERTRAEFDQDEVSATDPGRGRAERGRAQATFGGSTLQAADLGMFLSAGEPPTRPGEYRESVENTDVGLYLDDATPALDELPGPPLPLPPLSTGPRGVVHMTDELENVLAALKGRPEAPRQLTESGEKTVEMNDIPRVGPTDTTLRPAEGLSDLDRAVLEATASVKPSEMPTEVLQASDIEAEMKRMMEKSTIPPDDLHDAWSRSATNEKTKPIKKPADAGNDGMMLAIGLLAFAVLALGAVGIIVLAVIWNAA